MARFHYRELSVLEYRELYALCRRYARKWFIRYEMPMCDLDDTIVCAARIAGMSKQLFRWRLKIIRIDFAQCFKAYREHLEKICFTF